MSVSAPKLRDGFYEFSYATLADIDISDCDDTIYGKCLKNKTLSGCINECKNHPSCSYGYYIETPNQNLCAPIRSKLPNETFYFSRLLQQSVYPELDGTKSTVFVKKNGIDFPPNRSNIVFFADRLSLKSVLTGLFLNSNDDAVIKFDKKEFDIQLHDPNSMLYNNKEGYVPVLNGGGIALNLIGTSLYLTVADTLAGWGKGLNVFGNVGSFTITSLAPNAKIGDPIYYGESFYLTFGGKILLTSTVTTTLVQTDLTLDQVKQQNLGYVFTFIPDFDVYYLESGECKAIPLNQTVIDGVTATYNGHPTYRERHCWNSKTDYTLIGVFLILIFLIWFFRDRIKNVISTV